MLRYTLNVNVYKGLRKFFTIVLNNRVSLIVYVPRIEAIETQHVKCVAVVGSIWELDNTDAARVVYELLIGCVVIRFGFYGNQQRSAVGRGFHHVRNHANCSEKNTTAFVNSNPYFVT